jgi:hypothetical protein
MLEQPIKLPLKTKKPSLKDLLLLSMQVPRSKFGTMNILFGLEIAFRKVLGEGCILCDHGIVVLSPDFLDKKWPANELAVLSKKRRYRLESKATAQNISTNSLNDSVAGR